MKLFLACIYGARALIVIVFLLSPKDSLSFIIFSAALGFTYLSTVPPTAALVGKMFGPEFMATLFGFTLFSHQIGGFLGAYLGGYFFTLSGNYTFVWILDALLAVFAALVHLPIKEKMVENHSLNQELLKYKPKIDKSKNDKQSTGILLALLGAILFGGRVIKG